MGRGCVIVIVIAFVTLQALGAEYVINDTGHSVITLHVVFTQEVALENLDVQMPLVWPVGSSKEFYLSGGEVAPWGGVRLGWSNPDASIKTIGWRLADGAPPENERLASESPLLEDVQLAFGKLLWPAERQLILQGYVNLSDELPVPIEDLGEIPERRPELLELVVRSSFIEWLCGKATGFVEQGGIQIKGAVIDGRLDLFQLVVPFPVTFENCSFSQGVDATYSTLFGFEISGSAVPSIDLRGARVLNDLYMGDTNSDTRLVCAGGIDLAGARIDGDVVLSNARLATPGG